MLLYVAGAYSAPTKEERQCNIVMAGRVAAELWEKHHAVICPHANTCEWIVPVPASESAYQNILRGDLQMLARCDGIVMLPNWDNSRGARAERAYAIALGIPVWYYPDVPELHPTEIVSPRQCEAFAEILGQMYRTHLSKNADYSPSNILATAEVGLVTRLWDKVARLLNLTGFRITISEAHFEAPKTPKHESIDDTLMDTAVYSVIGLLLRQGRWGK